MMPTGSTCKALALVLRQELPDDIAAENAHLRAENERLRAEVRRLQAATMSPYTANLPVMVPWPPAWAQRGPCYAWEHFAMLRRNRIRYLTDKIIEAHEEIDDAERKCNAKTGLSRKLAKIKANMMEFMDRANWARGEEVDENEPIVKRV